MAETKIEWADYTFNPWLGCTKVSPACDHCYAEKLATQRLGVSWGPGQRRRRTAISTWLQPGRWNAKARRDGVRRRVFCASLADVFDAEVPDSWRDDLFDLIAETPHLDWLLLTKRPNVMLRYMTGRGAVPPNIWAGVTVENQAMADQRIPLLLQVPAAKRFLSCEPLLGPVDLGRIAILKMPPGSVRAGISVHALRGRYNESGLAYKGEWDITKPPPDHPGLKLDWVIAGGESGQKQQQPRPAHPDWIRALRDECQTAGVPFHFKQWGDWQPRAQWSPAERLPEQAIDRAGAPVPDDINPDDVGGQRFARTGKKAAGRLLDGRTWDEVPA